MLRQNPIRRLEDRRDRSARTVMCKIGRAGPPSIKKRLKNSNRSWRELCYGPPSRAFHLQRFPFARFSLYDETAEVDCTAAQAEHVAAQVGTSIPFLFRIRPDRS